MKVSIFLVAVAITCAFAFVHNHNGKEPFRQDIPITYLHNIQGASVNPLATVPRTSSLEPLDIATDIVRQTVGDEVTYIVQSAYATKHNGIHHSYLRQTYNGLEIFNADLNINIFNGQALSLGHSFYSGPAPASLSNMLNALEGVVSLALYLEKEVSLADLIISPASSEDGKYMLITGFPGANAPVRVRLGYAQVEGGSKLEPVWDIEVDLLDNWYNAHVSALNGAVVNLFNWVADVNTYNVYPFGTNDPGDGGRTIVVNPAVSNASPLGWHDQGNGRVFQNTRGNNAYIQENFSGGAAWENNGRPNGGTSNDYDFPIDFSQAPRVYINASNSNLFYWNNIIHDVFYQYGFDELSGNFQENNFGRGGREVDAVQANAQDGSGTNNANFATPIDGQRPRMRMYIWTTAIPNRDGDLDTGIITHEYAHGISNRLTGGPLNVNCLGTGEAGGMGEGWGDFFGTGFLQRSSYNRGTVFPMAPYSYNNPRGIRLNPYTTNTTVNPSTYSLLNTSPYSGVHAKGEVWCVILWEVYWNIVDDLGFSTDWYKGTGGNNELWKDVIDGMKLQPCNPNFVQARDAILQADYVNYGGKNLCRFWKGFAKRGLGLYALGTGTGRTTVVQSFDVPIECS